MSTTDAARPPQGAPPHPFRASPWYDPSIEHRPCRCPTCRPERAAARLLPVRIVLAVLGGIALPLVTLLANSHFHVVALGPVSTAAILLAIVGSAANLLLLPVRRDPTTRALRRDPPGSTALRVLLALGALWGCLIYGYFALLLLPLLPISALAILFFGLGLCGLSPYPAFALAVVQSRRALSALSDRIGRRRTVALALAALLLPLLGTAGLVAHRELGRRELEVALARIARQPPHSEERMRAIAGLAGAEHRLVEAYLESPERARRELLAEAYLRLRDQPLHEEVEARARDRRETMVRPFWYLDGAGGTPFAQRFWRF
jgi:hypothetical protein